MKMVILAEKKDKIYCGVIVVLLILWILSDVEIMKSKVSEPKNNRTEEFIGTCEIWNVCDYKPLFCLPYYNYLYSCPDEYQCWKEERNCIFKND